jgi:hypothetical protein
VLATGCPRLDDRVLWLDGQPHHPPAPEPGTGPITPRRTVLDPILLTAAVAAWPTVALVGSYKLLMMVIRSSQAVPDGISDSA